MTNLTREAGQEQKNKTEQQQKEAPVMKPVYILAIETSCDETSVAIVENGKIIRSNVISSQIETHQTLWRCGAGGGFP
ncbi:hypothetical protein QFZ77_001777 [Paenibacillus sp. V4I3]|nr:hypothetical protein [Paenibacillus sp. V4I3]